MCGIGGISRGPGRSSITHLKSFAIAAAEAVEKRGPHATGFGWVQDGESWYWKMPGPAHKVAPLLPLPNGVQTMLIHARWATHGRPAVNENNHPMVAPGLCLVHNGVLTNHGELFEMLGTQPETKTDSEALAHLLSYGPTTLGGSPAELLELVEGSAAIAWIDALTPDALHLARLRGRPMAIGWTIRGDLIMSSTLATLRLTAQRSRVRIAHSWEVPEGMYLRVEEGRIVKTETFRLPPARLRSVSKQLTLPVGQFGLVQSINEHRVTR